eukprot:11012846-Alexandrium_andersonii.AAC.1
MPASSRAGAVAMARSSSARAHTRRFASLLQGLLARLLRPRRRMSSPSSRSPSSWRTRRRS